MTPDDKRVEFRLDVPAAVVVEVESGDPAIGLAPRRLLCRLLDFSANGLRIRIDRNLPEGGIFQLGVRFAGDDRLLWLVGEVRWVRSAEGSFHTGFTLFDADHSDIAEWKTRVAGHL